MPSSPDEPAEATMAQKFGIEGHIRLWWDLDCGRCGEYSQMFGPNVGPGGMSREMRDAGWRKTRAEGWICPTCAEDAGSSR